MPDIAAANRSLNTIRTELEYLRDSGLMSPPQFNSIMAQLPVCFPLLSGLFLLEHPRRSPFPSSNIPSSPLLNISSPFIQCTLYILPISIRAALSIRLIPPFFPLSLSPSPFRFSSQLMSVLTHSSPSLSKNAATRRGPIPLHRPPLRPRNQQRRSSRYCPSRAESAESSAPAAQKSWRVGDEIGE